MMRVTRFQEYMKTTTLENESEDKKMLVKELTQNESEDKKMSMKEMTQRIKATMKNCSMKMKMMILKEMKIMRCKRCENEDYERKDDEKMSI